MQPIYLDHNATTPVDPAVIETVSETARTFWANPSSGHPLGTRACEELERCRTSIAAFIGAAPGEIIFTSGGTESDNLALIGVARARSPKGGHLAVSAVEHHAILESCNLLRVEGFEISMIPVDSCGRVDPADVVKVVREDTILVSVMHANNEVGTLQPVSEIGRILREREILFHTDAAQSVGKMATNVSDLHVDLLTCSSHKIYGPKGMGFLYVRKGTPMAPLLVGGRQEGGARSGTENLPGIAGLSKALEVAGQAMGEESPRLQQMRDDLFQELSEAINGLQLNGHPRERLPGTLSLAIPGVQSSEVLEHLNRAGICLSASAACATESIKPSHVLSAMGLSLERAAGTLRISLGRANSREEMPRVVEALVSAVRKLRRRVS